MQEQGQRLSEEIASLSTEETERGLVLTLGDVLFDFNRAELKPAANRTALKLVQFLQLNPRRVIRIEGYTDSVGDRQANLDLSRERAQAVADVLADLGVDPARMQVVGYGEAFPVTDNASNRGRAQNRRVEIVFQRQGPAQRAALSPAPSQGAPVPQRVRGFFRLANRVAPDFSVRTCARAGYHRDRTSSSGKPGSISTLYFVITSREAQMSSNETLPGLVIADSLPGHAVALQRYLSEECGRQVLAVVGDSDSLVERLADLPPESILITELGLPGQRSRDGIHLVEWLTRHCPQNEGDGLLVFSAPLLAKAVPAAAAPRPTSASAARWRR